MTLRVGDIVEIRTSEKDFAGWNGLRAQVLKVGDNPRTSESDIYLQPLVTLPQLVTLARPATPLLLVAPLRSVTLLRPMAPIRPMAPLRP